MRLKGIVHEIRWVTFKLVQRLKIRAFGFKRLLRVPAVPQNSNGKVLIHLGCGEIASPGFTNVDVCPGPHVHYVRDVRDLSVFPDHYADLVYACHLLEHIPRPDTHKVLWEWKRVLKVGGLLRLSVPDFDKLICVYEACDRDVQSIQGPLLGVWGGYNSHATVFNRRRLEELLESLGFTDVREWDPHEVEYHDFEDWASRCIDRSGQAFQISLNLEAVRPV